MSHYMIFRYNTLMDSDQQQDGTWAFRSEDAPGSVPSQQTNAEAAQPVSWTASEFIANHKSPLWYLGLLAVTALLSALVFFVFHDIISVICIVIVSILFAMLGGRKPRQLSYLVDSQGITIGGKFHPYSLFKSFAIMREGAMGYVNLLPLKRFMPELSVYYALEDEERIVDALGDNLPYEQREEHSFDRLMKRLRF